jgi:hypothetical protein
MIMASKPWTKEEIAALIGGYPDTPTSELAERFGRTIKSVCTKAFDLGLHKSAEYMAGPNGPGWKPGNSAGRATQFKNGSTPHNKGKKGFDPGGRARAAQFKPGSKPHNWLPVGTERINDGGYLERKETDTGNPSRDWIGIHRLLWIEHYGKIPDGHYIVFRNGDKTDLRIENLEAITKREQLARNSVHRLPEELAKLCQLKGALQRQINKRMKANEK